MGEGGRKELEGKTGVGPVEVQNVKLLRRTLKGKKDEGMHQSVCDNK